jgi:probable phosphoglycerate mutase
MKLYVTRHGQTKWNAENKICGITDIDLSDKGIEQAEQVAAKLTDCKIDIIIASPLKRARQTAQIISDTIGCDIIIEDRLVEHNYGIYEGVTRESLEFKYARQQFPCKYPEGESIFQVVYRIYSLIEEIKTKYQNKTILLVSHGGVCRVLNTYFNDLSNEEYYDYVMGNCELKEYNL